MKNMRHAKRCLVIIVAALAILTGVVGVGPSAAGDMQLVSDDTSPSYQPAGKPARATMALAA